MYSDDRIIPENGDHEIPEREEKIIPEQKVSFAARDVDAGIIDYGGFQLPDGTIDLKKISISKMNIPETDNSEPKLVKQDNANNDILNPVTSNDSFADGVKTEVAKNKITDADYEKTKPAKDNAAIIENASAYFKETDDQQRDINDTDMIENEDKDVMEPDSAADFPENPADAAEMTSDAQQLNNLNDKEKEKEKKKSNAMEFIEAIIIAVVLAAIIRLFIFEPFFIPSSSMEPTLQIGDRIIVNKIVYHFKEPDRGDIVVFKFPLDTKRDFVKRVIGLSGEVVEIKDSQLYINYEPVEETYLPEGLTMNDYGPVQVPDEQLLMLGDNRNNSDDSRVWGFLDKELIIGRTDVIYWPLSRMQLCND